MISGNGLVVVARGLALRVEETRPVLGLELLLEVPVDEDLPCHATSEAQGNTWVGNREERRG